MKKKTVLYITHEKDFRFLCVGVDPMKWSPHFGGRWCGKFMFDGSIETWKPFFSALGIRPPKPGKQIKVTIEKPAKCKVEEVGR